MEAGITEVDTTRFMEGDTTDTSGTDITAAVSMGTMAGTAAQCTTDNITMMTAGSGTAMSLSGFVLDY